jgi:hypothetical protein
MGRVAIPDSGDHKIKMEIRQAGRSRKSDHQKLKVE